MATVVAACGALVLCGGLAVGVMGCDFDDKSVVGRVLMALFEIPSILYQLLERLHLAWTVRLLQRALRWFMHARHPIIQILYCLLMFGAYGAFVWYGYPLLGGPFNLYMSTVHRYCGFANFVVCLWTFALASFSNPGIIHAENVTEYMRLYPYDDFLYSLKDCRTCQIPKVARSKHCATCNHCVSKFDHHCIWLNACVGERNHRWFLAYLLSNSVLLVYGVVACLSIILSEIVGTRLLEATFVNKATGERVPASYSVILQYLMYQHMPVMMVGMLCSVMGIVLVGFTGYHLHLLATNYTTNETFKWKEAEWHHGLATRKFKRAKVEFDKLQAVIDTAAAAAKSKGGAGEEAPPAGGEQREKGVEVDSKTGLRTLRLNPPAELVPCLEGRCEHAEHAQHKGRQVAGWTIYEPGPLPPHAYSRGLKRNVAESIWPPSMYGRPGEGKDRPAVAPLMEFARKPSSTQEARGKKRK